MEKFLLMLFYFLKRERNKNKYCTVLITMPTGTCISVIDFTYPSMMSSPYFMALLFCLVGLPWLRSGELWQPLDEGGLCATGPLSTITQSMDLLYTSTKTNNPWTVIHYL